MVPGSGNRFGDVVPGSGDLVPGYGDMDQE